MYNDISISPLQGVLNVGEELSYDANRSVEIQEVAAASIVQIDCWHGKDADFFSVLKDKFQIDGVLTNGCVLHGDGFYIMNISPGSFMAVSYEAKIWDVLAEKIPDDVAVMTDLSHSRTVLKISGAGTLDVLSKGVSIDLDETVFPLDHVKQTSIAHMGVSCYRVGKDEFKLFIFRGFAQSFFQWLTHNASDIGYRMT